MQKSGDMLQYFQDHPEKLEEKLERDKKKRDKVHFKKSVDKARKLSRRMKFQGMDISIETDKGESRHWYDEHSGEKGSTKMKYPYGYVRRTVGADGEHIDVYIGPEEDCEEVYVIHQMKKPDFEEYDEDKVMMGFESPKQAKAAYLMHYNSDKFFGSMDTMTVDEFKEEFVNKSMAAVIMVQSFDSPEYVDHCLKRVARMSDGQIMSLYKEIWGEDYVCRVADPDMVRDEIIGFLLDQRDRIQEQMMLQEMQQPSLGLEPSQSFISSPNENNAPSDGSNFETENGISMPSTDMYSSESSTNNEMEQFGHTR